MATKTATDFGHAPPKPFTRHLHTSSLLLLSLLALLLAFTVLNPLNPHTNHPSILPPTHLAHGLTHCAHNAIRPHISPSLPEQRLARPRTGLITTIANATLVNGDGSLTPHVRVSFQSGLIISVSNETSSATALLPGPDVLIDAHGRHLTPGLVDAHSHAGVRALPQLWATEDVTEVVAGGGGLLPVTPWARAVDGFKPGDAAVRRIAAGGVTTSLVLTGARNLISGEGVVVKMKGGRGWVGDLLVQGEDGDGGKGERYLKMAVGENQKREFEGSATGPATRLGSAGWLRRAFGWARALRERQDGWCERARKGERFGVDERYPEDWEWQTLVDVLRGDVRVNVHAYETQDVYMLLGLADEFGFRITALHHALHSEAIAEELRKRDIAVAAFSDSWGDKVELYNVSSLMLARLEEQGVRLVLVRDHPAEPGPWLAYEAQIGHHFGLSAEGALRSIMAEPARVLGLENRLGMIAPGFDADAVIWDRHPLAVGATPLTVFIDGVAEVNASAALWRESEELLHDQQPPGSRLETPPVAEAEACRVGEKDFVVTGVRRSWVGEGGKRLSREGIEADAPINFVVRNGTVACVGQCAEAVQAALEKGVRVLNLTDAWITPGATVLTRQHGLAEIRQEPVTTDGTSAGDDLNNVVSAVYGLQFGGIHLQRAYRAGVTRIITAPLTSGFLHGISATFRAGAKNALDDNAIINPSTALHFSLDPNGKDAPNPPISTRIQTLHTLLSSPPHPAYALAANGSLPLILHTHSATTIAQLILLKTQHFPSARLIIAGGAEAHLLAADLASARIPVILAPWGCEQLWWSQRRCLPGPPLTDRHAAALLLDAGVEVALGNLDDTNNHVRNVWWEAGWVMGGGAGAGKERARVMRMLAGAVEEMLGLDGEDAGFVVWEGEPWEFGATVALVVEGGVVRACWPGPDEEGEVWEG